MSRIVIHNYRWRLGLAEGEPKYDDLEKRLAAAPVIAVPTITLEGDANGAPHPEPSAYAKKFSGKYAHRTITGGIGHNLPQEAPAGLCPSRDRRGGGLSRLVSRTRCGILHAAPQSRAAPNSAPHYGPGSAAHHAAKAARCAASGEQGVSVRIFAFPRLVCPAILA